MTVNKRTFAKNTAIMTATSLLLRTLGIVFRVFISNRVGAEGMGLYQLVFSVYILGTTFASAGLTTAVTCLVAESAARNRQQDVRRVIRISGMLSIIIGGASAVLLYVGAPTIGRWLGDERAVSAIAISGIALPIIGISACIKGYFTAVRRAAPPSIAQILEQLVRIGSVLWMLTRSDGSIEQSCCIIIVGDMISETVACVYLGIAYLIDRHRTDGDVHTDRRPLLRPMLHIALPLTAGRYLSTALRTVENFLVPARLTLFTHSDAVSLQQFGALKGMALPLIFFPSAFLMTVSNLMVPELSDAMALHRRRQITTLVERTLHITALGAILIGCIFTTFGRSLGQLLYQDDNVGLFLQILGPLTPVMYLDSVAAGMLKGLGEQVSTLWHSVADSVVRILLIWLILPHYGIIGFLFVMLVSNLLTASLSVSRILSASGARMRWGRWILRPSILAVIATLAHIVLHGVLQLEGLLHIVIGGIAIIAVYIVGLPILRCFTREDLMTLRRRA